MWSSWKRPEVNPVLWIALTVNQIKEIWLLKKSVLFFFGVVVVKLVMFFKLYLFWTVIFSVAEEEEAFCCLECHRQKNNKCWMLRARSRASPLNVSVSPDIDITSWKWMVQVVLCLSPSFPPVRQWFVCNLKRLFWAQWKEDGERIRGLSKDHPG